MPTLFRPAAFAFLPVLLALFAFNSSRTSAGLITSQIDIAGADPTSLEVGQVLDVTVKLDGFDPSNLSLWMTTLQLSDTFANPTDFNFDGPGIFIPGGPNLFVDPGTIPTGGLTTSGGLTVSLAGWGIFSPTYSFRTEVVSAGAGFIHVGGALLRRFPFSFSSVEQVGPATLTTFANTAAPSVPSPSPPTPPGSLTTPEPSSLSIFAALGLYVACRRHRRANLPRAAALNTCATD
ncbi:hypothetical protein [Planctomycetes bacterium TBK1r]|uniref:PEP-CTERM protein-sorting domain-containing protein n=1 Tax=Stieleria magnilauensis TaxID=2527963 RepID=A0ABX5XT58_9BACT|nr:hypothetical protein TBK1r_20140 [Planctomycetes bacterium TBK1r]